MLPTIRIAGQDYQLTGCPPEDVTKFAIAVRCMEKAYEIGTLANMLVGEVSVILDPPNQYYHQKAIRRARLILSQLDPYLNYVYGLESGSTPEAKEKMRCIEKADEMSNLLIRLLDGDGDAVKPSEELLDYIVGLKETNE